MLPRSAIVAALISVSASVAIAQPSQVTCQGTTEVMPACPLPARSGTGGLSVEVAAGTTTTICFDIGGWAFPKVPPPGKIVAPPLSCYSLHTLHEDCRDLPQMHCAGNEECASLTYGVGTFDPDGAANPVNSGRFCVPVTAGSRSRVALINARQPPAPPNGSTK